MSAIPAFEIGVWNAWIFMLLFVLHPLVTALFQKHAWKKLRSPANPLNTSFQIKVRSFSEIIRVPAIIYSIFLPLRIGTSWFYIGLSMYLVGAGLFLILWINWATTEPDQPITRGIYRYSRHPMYITGILTLIGTSLASASWVFLLFTIFMAASWILLSPSEERDCIQKYGDTYRKYMNKTPRWIGLPKS